MRRLANGDDEVFRRRASWAVLIALHLLTCRAIAASPVASDPCAVTEQRAAPSPRLQARIQIERDSAVYIAKHIQRTCRLIGDLARDNSIQSDRQTAIELRTLSDKLREGVLAYIYREYPDLRGQDLTSAQTKEDERINALRDARNALLDKAPRLEPARQMGPATALYLRWALVDARTSVSKAFKRRPCGAALVETCIQALMDITAEIGFADAPVYSSFPGLWRIALKEGDALADAQPHTAESDAAFRKAAPTPGSVRLSPAALSVIRDFLDTLRRESGDTCEVVSIFWGQETRWKGPEDSEWKTAGPSLDIGAYSCKQIPPDVVQTIDGIWIVFGGDEAKRFTGKVVDRENGKFVLREP